MCERVARLRQREREGMRSRTGALFESSSVDIALAFLLLLTAEPERHVRLKLKAIREKAVLHWSAGRGQRRPHLLRPRGHLRPMPQVAQRFVAVAACDERAGEREISAGEARVDLEGAAVGGDGDVAALRFAEVKPGQDEVGAAG